MMPRTFLNNIIGKNCCLLIFVIIFLTLFLDKTLAIKCYKCDVDQTNYHLINGTLQEPLLCKKFDESKDYIVDCPFSTMCLKKINKLQLNGGETIETVTRNCASQKNKNHVYRKGNWEEEPNIEEPYEEGCADLYSPETGSTSTYCHCRGHLCNSATKDSSGLHTDAMAVIFVFNAMKYLNSGIAQY